MSTASLKEETAKKVLRQVEFYFSDSNLPRDTFLKKSISESDDGNGISEDTVKSVVEVLSQSSSLKISEDGKKIGRVTELLNPEEVVEQLDARTVAASPLAYDAKLEDVEPFFGRYAKVNSVRLPRHVADKKLFCGTVLIEFVSEEDAENVLKQSLVYAGADLALKQKKDFDAEREKEAREVEKLHPHMGSNHWMSSNDGANNYPKGLIVAFTLKSMLLGGSQEENSNLEPADEDGCKTNGKQNSTENVSEEMECVSENHHNNKENHRKNVEETVEKVDEKTTSDSEGKENDARAVEKDDEKATTEGKFDAAYCKDNKDVVMREDLKEVFKKFGTVKFIDFKIGAESGFVRFESPEAAQKARAAAVLAEEGGLIVKNFVAALEPVTEAANPMIDKKFKN